MAPVKTWWVLIPIEDKGKPASFLEKVDFRLQFGPGTKEYALLRARKPIQFGPGLQLIYWRGPYATEAEAKKVQNPQPSPENPVPALSGLNAIGDFFARLTEASTWIRVGEVVAGGLLLYVGVKALVTPAGANVGKRTVKDTASHIKTGVKKAAEIAAMPK
jgi:hypothetical protein